MAMFVYKTKQICHLLAVSPLPHTLFIFDTFLLRHFRRAKVGISCTVQVLVKCRRVICTEAFVLGKRVGGIFLAAPAWKGVCECVCECVCVCVFHGHGHGHGILVLATHPEGK